MISLIAKWTIKRGHEEQAIAALKELARNVEQENQGVEPEKKVLVYLCHTPNFKRYECSNGDAHESLPTPAPQEVIFFEQYATEEAFCEHLNSHAFKGFLQSYGHLFLSSDGGPFVQIEFLHRQAGFISEQAVTD